MISGTCLELCMPNKVDEKSIKAHARAKSPAGPMRKDDTHESICVHVHICRPPPRRAPARLPVACGTRSKFKTVMNPSPRNLPPRHVAGQSHRSTALGTLQFNFILASLPLPVYRLVHRPHPDQTVTKFSCGRSPTRESLIPPFSKSFAANTFISNSSSRTKIRKPSVSQWRWVHARTEWKLQAKFGRPQR